MQAVQNAKVYKFTAQMSPVHRGLVLAKIKTDLTRNSGSEQLKVIVCSTSAIETGVDIDCDRGYREISGLDSIVQFAGRINRNASRLVSEVVVFRTAQEYSFPIGTKTRIAKTTQARAEGVDLQSPDVLKHYSDLVFTDAMRPNPKAFNFLEALAELKYESVSDEWEMIAETQSILIDPRLYDAPSKIVLEYDEAIANANYKVLQRHCIGLYKNKYDKSLGLGLITQHEFLRIDIWSGDYDNGIIV
jgi:CRISPR-associated endonuclease/helicase Cas3